MFLSKADPHNIPCAARSSRCDRCGLVQPDAQREARTAGSGCGIAPLHPRGCASKGWHLQATCWARAHGASQRGVQA